MIGRLNGLAYTRGGDCLLTISTREDCGALMDDLADGEVDVTIRKRRKKRSLDANGMYWSTLAQLARVLGVSNNHLHNEMIRRYGQPEYYGEKLAYIMLPDSDETEEKALEAETYHIRPTSHTKAGSDGLTYRAYMLMRGSSTYNTQEFSRLLDGLIEECKHAGIKLITGRYD